MDRREALKKLGVGGAAVAGASVIISQPAFAYDNPTVTAAGSVVINPFNFSGSDVVITNPTVTCPGSASPAGVPSTMSRTITITSNSISGGVWYANPNILPGGAVVPASPGVSATSTSTSSPPVFSPVVSYFSPGLVRKRTSPGVDPYVDVVSGDTFTVDVSFTFTCTYSDSTTRTATTSASATFTATPP